MPLLQIYYIKPIGYDLMKAKKSSEPDRKIWVE